MIPTSFTDADPPSAASAIPRPGALPIPDARSHETAQVNYSDKHDGRNEASIANLECSSMTSPTVVHQNPDIINAGVVQATLCHTGIPIVTFTPEQERLQSLQQKNEFLMKTVQQLRTRHRSLLHTLYHQLPSPPHIQQLRYHPSTFAHSTPSSIPNFSKDEEEAIMQQVKEIIKNHIASLHTYNEIKDVAQGLMGMVADARGVRVAELYEGGEFGVSEKD